jgi:hypothetical protein
MSYSVLVGGGSPPPIVSPLTLIVIISELLWFGHITAGITSNFMHIAIRFRYHNNNANAL